MKATLIAVLVLFCGACVWQPITYTDSARDSTAGAIEAFRAGGELDRFFSEAVAYAVFPASVRAGTGFGGAYGGGWLFENGEVSGKVSMLEIFAGVDLGVQAYRSILFFRNADVLRRFRRGRFEFTGQANATVITAGKSLTPSYNQDVAMFVQVRGGLMLEVSVGAQRYDYFPLMP